MTRSNYVDRNGCPIASSIVPDVTRSYPGCKFRAEHIAAAIKAFAEMVKPPEDWTEVPSFAMDSAKAYGRSVDRSLSIANDTWTYDSDAEFLNDYRQDIFAASYKHWLITKDAAFGNRESAGLEIRYYRGRTEVRVQNRTKAEALEILAVFDAAADEVRIVPPEPEPQPLRIFLGHGGQSKDWQTLLIELTHIHGITTTAFETGSREGHTIRDVLSSELGASTFALLILTAEDQQLDGKMRARQNVIHEAGLFQGRLGFDRAILLLEDGVEDFSNNAGTQHIRFERGKIDAVVGKVLGVLRREQLLNR